MPGSQLPDLPDLPVLSGDPLAKLETAAALLRSFEADLDALGLPRLGRAGPDDVPVPGPSLPDLVPLVTDIDKILAKLRGLKPSVPSALQVVGVELTQSTQFFNLNGKSSGTADDNSIPLIANKMTILRVYVARRQDKTGYVPSRFTGEVRVAGQHIQPLNGPQPLQNARALLRGLVNDSLNFRIPASLCKGVREFEVVIYDPDRLHNSPAIILGLSGRSSVTEAVGAHFWPQPPMRVQGVMISYGGPNGANPPWNIPAPNGIALVDTLARMLPMFPIHGYDFGPCTIYHLTDDISLPITDKKCGWNTAINEIASRRSASTMGTFFVGLMPKGLPVTVGATTLGIGRAGCAVAPQDFTRSLSHELGHACGLNHVQDGSAAAPFDLDFPKYASFPDFSIGEFGVNSERMTIFDPSNDRDVMMYWDAADVPHPAHTWISPFNYMRMYNRIRSSDGTGDITLTASIVIAAASPMMILNFRLNRDGKVELKPSWRVTCVPALVGPRAQIPVRIELLDRHGEVLDSIACHEHNPYQDPEGPFLDFHEVVPWPDTVAAVAILRDGHVIDRLAVEGAPPRVELANPRQSPRKDGLMRLEWTIHKHDQPCTAMVRYTHDDGETFQAIAAHLTDTSLVANLDLLPGGERCWFEVIVAAGLNNTTVRTEPFTVQRKPRKAVIVSPTPDQHFAPGRSVPLIGGGYSPDGGLCEADDAFWQSNVDGRLGTGHNLVIDRLSPGLHRISLALPDGCGGEASASLWIRVDDAGEHCERPM